MVCKACGCGCGTEWNPDVAGHHRCKSCSICFPGIARLNLENGKSITMSELQVGDRVQTGIGILCHISEVNKACGK